MAARQPIGAGRETQRADMRRHVDAVGQQRHRAEQDAGRDLDHHEQRRDRGRETRAPLGLTMAMAQKDMAVRPGVVIVGVVGHAPHTITQTKRAASPARPFREFQKRLVRAGDSGVGAQRQRAAIGEARAGVGAVLAVQQGNGLAAGGLQFDSVKLGLPLATPAPWAQSAAKLAEPSAASVIGQVALAPMASL